MRHALLLILAVTLGGPAAAAPSYTLVVEGRPRCALVVGEKASPPERHAAAELGRYLQKISGAEVPQVPTAPAGTFAISLGTPETCPALAGAGLLKEVKAISDDGFVLHCGAGGLFIAARKPLGVLYGAYALLEEHLGVRWYFPGAAGEFCPRGTTIRLPTVHSVQNPAFKTRTLVLTCTNVTANTADTWDWMVRNRMQVWSGKAPYRVGLGEGMAARGARIQDGGHCLAYLVSDKLFDTHPEYFALVGGRRVPQLPAGGGIHQLCTTHPEVVERATKGILASMRDAPAADSYLIGNNDGNGWCECESCRAGDDPWEAGHGFVSTRFYRFINTVAARVLAEVPNKEIQGWAYQIYQQPPRGVRPDPRLAIWMCMHGRCYRHSLTDPRCPRNVRHREMLEGWLAFGNRVGMREYYSCFIGGEVIPYVPLEEIMVEDVRYAWKAGCTGWRDEVPPPDGVFGKTWDNRQTRESWQARMLAYYLTAHLLWNPKADVDALQEDFFRGYYGPAAVPMREYRRLLTRCWSDAEGCLIYGASPTLIGKSLTRPGAEKRLLELLASAEAAAGADTAVAGRVAREKEYLSLVWQAAFARYSRGGYGEVTAARRTAPVRVDGVLDEPDWKSPEYGTGLLRSDGKPAGAQSFYRLLYDDKGLYLAVEAMEPEPAKLLTRFRKNDEEIWGDDALELFLDVKGEGREYYHLAVNSAGALYDSRCAVGGQMEKAVNTGCEVKCRVLQDRWVLELRLDAAALGAATGDGQRWRACLARTRRAGGQPEYSTWSDGAFHQPASFRPVVFGGAPRLRNGGFEETVTVNDDRLKRIHLRQGWEYGNEPVLFPAGWGLHEGHPGKATLLAEGAHAGRYAWRIEKGGWIHQLFPAATGETLGLHFWARGQGETTVMLFQYAKAPDGSRRNAETIVLGNLALTPEWKQYHLRQALAEKDLTQVAAAFAAGERLDLDDIWVGAE